MHTIKLLNISMVVCPHCKTYKLRFNDRLLLSPNIPGICLSCGMPFLGTYRSLVIKVFFSILIPTLADQYFELGWRTESLAFFVMSCYFFLCPIIAQTKKHKFVDKVWYLPESRFVGYTVYLVIPSLVIIGSLLIAAKYKVGF